MFNRTGFKSWCTQFFFLLLCLLSFLLFNVNYVVWANLSRFGNNLTNLTTNKPERKQLRHLKKKKCCRLSCRLILSRSLYFRGLPEPLARKLHQIVCWLYLFSSIFLRLGAWQYDFTLFSSSTSAHWMPYSTR